MQSLPTPRSRSSPMAAVGVLATRMFAVLVDVPTAAVLPATGHTVGGFPRSRARRPHALRSGRVSVACVRPALTTGSPRPRLPRRATGRERLRVCSSGLARRPHRTFPRARGCRMSGVDACQVVGEGLGRHPPELERTAAHANGLRDHGPHRARHAERSSVGGGVVGVVGHEPGGVQGRAANVGLHRGAGVRVAIGVMQEEDRTQNVLVPQPSGHRLQLASQVARGRVQSHTLPCASVPALRGVADRYPRVEVQTAREGDALDWAAPAPGVRKGGGGGAVRGDGVGAALGGGQASGVARVRHEARRVRNRWHLRDD
eukprot:scaffold16222_cov146-Isochrysis_galbana.AAC.2